MKIVAIVQARIGSTRLPGKVLLPLAGQPMLKHIIQRVQRAKSLDAVVLAVPKEPDSHRLEVMAEETKCIYGRFDHIPAEDLVDRYLGAAMAYRADVVVRICADNPCIDPVYIDQAVYSYLNGCYPFYTNTTALTRDYVAVDGLGCEVLSFSRLQWLDRITKGKPDYREHPHLWFYEHGHYKLPKADVRLDINDQTDYEFIRDIYQHVPAQFTTDDVMQYLGINATMKKGAQS